MSARIDLDRKIELLSTAIGRLRNLAPANWEDYQRDEVRALAIERVIMSIIDVSTDINLALLVRAGHNPASSSYTSFTALAGIDLVAADAAKGMARIAGLRNRLAHDYEDVDPRAVYDAIHGTIDLFSRYLATVRRRLDEPRSDTD